MAISIDSFVGKSCVDKIVRIILFEHFINLALYFSDTAKTKTKNNKLVMEH
jgi:hypothetical protein